MKCQRCGSDRILDISAKCSDLCFSKFKDIEKDGYVPGARGVGGGNYVDLGLGRGECHLSEVPGSTEEQNSAG